MDKGCYCGFIRTAWGSRWLHYLEWFYIIVVVLFK